MKTKFIGLFLLIISGCFGPSNNINVSEPLYGVVEANKPTKFIPTGMKVLSIKIYNYGYLYEICDANFVDMEKYPHGTFTLLSSQKWNIGDSIIFIEIKRLRELEDRSRRFRNLEEASKREGPVSK